MKFLGRTTQSLFPEEVTQANKFMNIRENNTNVNFCLRNRASSKVFDILGHFLYFFLLFHMFSQKMFHLSL